MAVRVSTVDKSTRPRACRNVSAVTGNSASGSGTSSMPTNKLLPPPVASPGFSSRSARGLGMIVLDTPTDRPSTHRSMSAATNGAIRGSWAAW